MRRRVDLTAARARIIHHWVPFTALAAAGCVAVALAVAYSGGSSSDEHEPGRQSAKETVIPPPTQHSLTAAERRWPNAYNTGVPPGTKLTPSGSLTIVSDGVTISNLDVSGGISVRADNVTIERTRIRGGRIVLGTDYHGIMIRDVEIDGENEAAGVERVPAVGISGYTCVRCNVHGWNSGFDVGNDVTIVDSWVHDIGPPSAAHKTALGSNGGSHIVVKHNSLTCEVDGCSAAIAFYGDFAPIHDLLVTDNLFNSEGSYCSYSGTLDGKKYPNATDVRWTDNHYGRKFHPTCGIYGPATGWGTQGGNVWSGNVYDGSGKPIPAA